MIVLWKINYIKSLLALSSLDYLAYSANKIRFYK